MKVKVCDSIPGSGKTEAAIAMMNATPDKKYIFVTPYLSETDRIKQSCPALRFKQPESGGVFYRKIDSLNAMLEKGENAVHSHALFSFYTDVTRKLIREHGYTLILDEVMNVVCKIDVSRCDIGLMLEAGYMDISDDGSSINWINEEYGCGSGGLGSDIKKKSKVGGVVITPSRDVFWKMPVCNFNCFDDVYILTYLFCAQIQRYYYEINGIEFEYIGVRKTERGYEFSEQNEIPDYGKKLIDRVHIVDDVRYNSVGDKRTALSSNWYDVHQKYGAECLSGKERWAIDKSQKVAKNFYNIFHNKFRAKVADAIWTTYKSHKDRMSNKRYEKRFVSCNTRATNEYRNCHYLAYMVNIFFDPKLSKFFKSYGVKIDNDLYALSEMVQWVWRSAIRQGEEIWVYIPSKRMRDLMVAWLESLSAGQDVSEYLANKKRKRKKGEERTRVGRCGRRPSRKKKDEQTI